MVDEETEDAEEVLFMCWHECGCERCTDADLWYEALALLMAERAPA